MTPEQAESLRHAVREFLAIRFPTAHPPRAILRTVAREVDFAVNESEVIAACQFLAGLGEAKFEHDALGASNYWSATCAGVLAHERKGAH